MAMSLTVEHLTVARPHLQTLGCSVSDKRQPKRPAHTKELVKKVRDAGHRVRSYLALALELAGQEHVLLAAARQSRLVATRISSCICWPL